MPLFLLGGSLQIIGAPYFPVTLTPNGQVAPLLAGDLIGEDTPLIFAPFYEVDWAGVDFKGGMFNMLFPPIRRVGQSTLQSGTFVGPEIYLGFRLWEEDGWHYGRMRFSGDQLFGLVVHEYAYETEPNVPILAGRPIPEPSAASLFGLAGAWGLLRRTRLASRCKSGGVAKQTPSLPGPGPARDATREKQIPFRKNLRSWL